MATPTYFGAGPASAGNGGGWLARLGSYFGDGGTPSYAGDGQPSNAGGGFLRGSTPAYAPAPVNEPVDASASPDSDCADEEPAEPVMCPIDPEALAAGQIAIVIPR